MREYCTISKIKIYRLVVGLIIGAVVLFSGHVFSHAEEPSGECIAEGECGDDVIWKLYDNGLLEISGNGNMYNYWDRGPFYSYSDSITDVKIGVNVTSIGGYAFMGLDSLEHVEIGSDVKKIGDSAFRSCSSLKSVVLPDSLEEIGNGIFAYCSSLNYISIPDGVRTQGNSNQMSLSYVLYGCTLLKSAGPVGGGYNIEYACTDRIPCSYFAGLTSLTKVVLPQTIETIESGAFFGCSSLKEIILPGDLETIGGGAFYNCSSLEHITIPDNVRSVGQYINSLNIYSTMYLNGQYIDATGLSKGVFEGCTLLKSAGPVGGDYDIEYEWSELVIPNTFKNCTSLEEVVIGDEITKIGSNAFSGCSTITEMDISDSVNIIEYSAFEGCSDLRSIQLPNALKSISDGLFKGCEALEEIVIPEGVTTIGSNVFNGCTGLTGITIPNSVTFLGESCFSDCVNLESIEMSDELKVIGGEAFKNCGSLSGIDLGNKLTSIGSNAFEGCSSLEEIVIPDGVEGTLSGTFKDCTSLTTVTLPKSIGGLSETFFNCTALTTVTMPSYLASYDLDGRVFYGCSNLKSIELPAMITSIPEYAFYKCSSLETIKLPYTIRSIGDYAFDKCTSLENIYYNCSKDYLDSVEIEIGVYNSRLKNAQNKFYSEHKVEGFSREGLKWYIDNDILYILGNGVIGGRYTEPWDDFSSEIKTLNVGSGITRIETIGYCSALENVNLPKTLNAIREYAFSLCDSITNVYYEGSPSAWAALGIKKYYGNDSLLNATFTFGEEDPEPDPDDHGDIVEQGDCGENVAWALYEDGTMIVSGEGDMCDYASSSSRPFYYSKSKIKEVLVGPGVTSIGNFAFYECYQLENVVLFDGIIKIGEYAFGYSNTLKKVVFPDTLTEIGNHAFINCKVLNDVVLPESINRIGERAFYATGIVEIVIPSGVTSVGEASFRECSSLQSVIIGEGVKNIEYRAFHDCNNLKYFLWPEFSNANSCLDNDNLLKTAGPKEGGYDLEYSWTDEIPDYGFVGLAIESVVLPGSITKIGEYAFEGCGALEEVALPEGLTEIGRDAFCYSGLVEIEIPGSVVSLGEEYRHPFYDCKKLKRVVINEGVQSIGQSCFEDCNNLEYVRLSESLRNFDYDAFPEESSLKSAGPLGGGYNIEFSWTDEIPDNAFFASSIESVVLPDSISRIGRYAFADSKLKSIELPVQLREIDQYAFRYCNNLISVVIPSSVFKIAGYAFYSCDNLESVVLPDSPINIEGNSFGNCKNLDSVVIPDGVRSFETNVFTGCPKMKTAGPIGSGCNFEFGWKSEVPKNVFSGGAYLTSVTLPDTITEISEKAFYDCKTLEGIQLSSNLEMIGESAFSGCSTLLEVLIPNKVHSIGKEAFKSCNALQTIQLSQKLKKIDEGVFSKCISVKSVEIPESVSTISKDAFSYCTDLESVSIPYSVKYIGDFAFFKCAKLADVYYGSTQEYWDKIFFGTNTDELGMADKHFSDYEPGDIQDGWNQIDGRSYYSENGSFIVSDVRYITDAYYGFDSLGRMYEDTVFSLKKDGITGYYRADDEGKLLTDQWYTDNWNRTYYYGEDAKGVSGIVQIGQNKYMFRNDGFLLKNSSMSVSDGDYVSDENGIATLTHTHVFTEVEAKDANCSEYGNIAYRICEGCGKMFVEDGTTELSSADVIIAKADHTPSEAVIENEVAGGCTHQGMYDSVVYCSVCGEELSRETIRTEIDENSHTPLGTLIRVDILAPTCSREGEYVEISVCKECGKEISREIKKIEKFDHTPSEVPAVENIVEPYEDEEGEHAGHYDEVIYCSVCGEELSREEKEYSGTVDPDAGLHSIEISLTGEGGEVTVGKERAVTGERIQLNVLHEEGYELKALVVTDGDGNRISITDNGFTMPDSDVGILAEFGLAESLHLISITQPEVGGSVFADKEKATIGEEVKLTVVAATGYRLSVISVKDEDDHDIGLEAGSFIMPDGDVSVTASFEADIYSIITDELENGRIEVVESAYAGDIIEIKAVPDVGYETESLSVRDEDGTDLAITSGSFIMPAKTVTVSARFEAMEPTIITVNRCDIKGEDIAVDITGTGTYEYGEEIVLIAPRVDGYNFIGWYEYSESNPHYTGGIICKNNGYSFRNTEDKDLVAVYEALGTVSLTINGGRNYTINGKSKSTEVSTSYPLGTNVSLVAKDSGFAYWKNSYGKVLSRSEAYEFTVTGTDVITAVYNAVIEDQVTLVFESVSEQVMARVQLGMDDTMIIPVLPYRYGYEAIGWDLDGNGEYDEGSDTLTAAVTRGLLTDDHVLIIRPVYRRIDAKYTITVVGGSGSGDYDPDTMVWVELDEGQIPDGKKFSHWKDDSDNIRSYSTRMSFRAGKDEIITAVYVDQSEQVEQKGTTAFVDVQKDKENNTMSFVTMSTVPEGCAINMAGLVATTDTAIGTSGDNFNDQTATYVRGRSWTGTEYRYTWTKGSMHDGDTWYVRAYLQYTDPAGNIYTIYGDMHQVVY